MILLRVILCLVLLAAVRAHAAPWCDRVAATVTSYHFDRSKEYEEFNPGVGCEWVRDADNTIAAGGYRNSFGDSTAYLFHRWQPLTLGPLRFGLVYGLFYGYEHRVTLLPPIPAVRYDNGPWGVNAYIATSVIGFQITRSLD